MELLHSEYKDRIAHWQRVLAQDFYRPEGEIAFEGFTTMDHLTPEQAADGGFRPVPVGTVWGHTWEYLWLRATVTLPEETAGKAVAMSLDMGGEATLFVNGQAFGTRRAEWVSVPHHYISDNVLTRCAEPGQKFDLLFEVYRTLFPRCGWLLHRPRAARHAGRPQGQGQPHPVGPQHLRRLERGRLPAVDGRIHPVHADGRTPRGFAAGGQNRRRPRRIHPHRGL